MWKVPLPRRSGSQSLDHAKGVAPHARGGLTGTPRELSLVGQAIRGDAGLSHQGSEYRYAEAPQGAY